MERIRNIKSYDSKAKEKEPISLKQIVDLRLVIDQVVGIIFWILLWFGIRVGELKQVKNIDWEKQQPHGFDV